MQPYLYGQDLLWRKTLYLGKIIKIGNYYYYYYYIIVGVLQRLKNWFLYLNISVDFMSHLPRQLRKNTAAAVNIQCNFIPIISFLFSRLKI